MSRAKRRSTKKQRFYCNINARRDGHALKNATIQEIKWIFKIHQEDEDNNFFLADSKHYQKLTSFAKNATSDPDKTITKEQMIKKHFAQFDVANARKWSVFEEKCPNISQKITILILIQCKIQMTHPTQQLMMILKRKMK